MRILPFAIATYLFAGQVNAVERAAIYPFDVKIAGHLAKIEGNPDAAIFARLATPVAADAAVEVVVEPKPASVIVNIFAVDKDGSPKDGAAPKIIIATGPEFTLADTMDQSKLAPGIYGMNVVVGSAGTSRIWFEVSENAARGGPALDQSTPEQALAAVFEAARTGKFESLVALFPPSGKGDGDVKDVCGVAEAPKDKQKEFVEYFAKGKINGKARIEGKKAEVDFLFGPTGTKKETMELVEEGGKWYLAQF
jgi:hypothetical protein